jgi:hypothetical protein
VAGVINALLAAENDIPVKKQQGAVAHDFFLLILRQIFLIPNQ